jgi:leucyl-tRNA---protein transferase
MIHQDFETSSASPSQMDQLWAAGWRHFGCYFFRYSHQITDTELEVIQPLRVDLQRFALTKSQRRVLNKNRDVQCTFQPAERSPAAEALFQRHKTRFTHHIPDSLSSFLSPAPATLPNQCLQCRVTLADELVALSYLDVGLTSSSSVYGMFEPAHSRRSLGLFTLLQEIAFSQAAGHRWFYPGYATQGHSAYDYKKQLTALQYLNWQTGQWQDLQPTAYS